MWTINSFISWMLWLCIAGTPIFEFQAVTAANQSSPTLQQDEDGWIPLKVYEGGSIVLECNFPEIVDLNSYRLMWYHGVMIAAVGQHVLIKNFKQIEQVLQQKIENVVPHESRQFASKNGCPGSLLETFIYFGRSRLVNSPDLFKRSYNLQILEAKNEVHSGLYKCLVSEFGVGDKPCVTYNLIVVSSIKSVVISPPYPITREGATVTLTCKIGGSSGHIQVSWLHCTPTGWYHLTSKNGAMVTTEDRRTSNRSSDDVVSTVVLEKVTQKMVVMCLARNLETRDKLWVERTVVIKIGSDTIDVDNDEDEDEEEPSLTITEVTIIDRGPTYILFRWNPFYVEVFGRPRYTIIYSLLLPRGPKSSPFDCAFSNKCNLTGLEQDSSYAIQVIASTSEWTSEPSQSFQATTAKVVDPEMTKKYFEEKLKEWNTDKGYVLDANFTQWYSGKNVSDEGNRGDDAAYPFVSFVGDCLVFFGTVVLNMFVIMVLVGVLLFVGNMLGLYWWFQIQPPGWV